MTDVMCPGPVHDGEDYYAAWFTGYDAKEVPVIVVIYGKYDFFLELDNDLKEALNRAYSTKLPDEPPKGMCKTCYLEGSEIRLTPWHISKTNPTVTELVAFALCEAYLLRLVGDGENRIPRHDFLKNLRVGLMDIPTWAGM